MALVTCSECGKQISDKSIQCIGCGAPTSDQIARAIRSEPDKTDEFLEFDQYKVSDFDPIIIEKVSNDGCTIKKINGSIEVVPTAKKVVSKSGISAFDKFEKGDILFELRDGGTKRVYANFDIESWEKGNMRLMFSKPRVEDLYSNDSSRKDREKIGATSSDKASNFLIRVLGAIAVAWLIFTEDGQSIINSILKGMVVETDIAKYDCNKVAELVKGKELQNAFGVKSKILKLTNLKQTSKTDEKIVCEAFTTTSRGEDLMEISVEKAGNNQIIYSVQPK